MNIEIDIDNIKEFVMSENFREFLLNNTTDFGTAAFVFQTLFEKIEELEGSSKEE